MNLKKAAVVIGLAVFGGFGFQAVQADEDFVRSLFEAAPDDYIKTRAYVGALGHSSSIDTDGDFNNSLIFSHDYSGNMETNLVPSISRNFGYGGLVGYRTGAWAAEVSLWISEHESVWSDRLFPGSIPTTFFGVASFQSINIDFKRYILTKYPAQPFFCLGVSFPWLVVEDGSMLDLGSGVTIMDDATISGIGLNIGVGLELYLSTDYSLVAGVTERFGGYNQINGAAKQAANILTMTGNSTEQGNLAGNGLNFYVAATIGFE